jgi:uncharacterized spore protein YtfJ
MTMKRVFGEPIERGGVTVIPVANVTGGFGGGRGDQRGNGTSGGGLSLRGLTSLPVTF